MPNNDLNPPSLKATPLLYAGPGLTSTETNHALVQSSDKPQPPAIRGNDESSPISNAYPDIDRGEGEYKEDWQYNISEAHIIEIKGTKEYFDDVSVVLDDLKDTEQGKRLLEAMSSLQFSIRLPAKEIVDGIEYYPASTDLDNNIIYFNPLSTLSLNEETSGDEQVQIILFHELLHLYDYNNLANDNYSDDVKLLEHMVVGLPYTLGENVLDFSDTNIKKQYLREGSQVFNVNQLREELCIAPRLYYSDVENAIEGRAYFQSPEFPRPEDFCILRHCKLWEREEELNKNIQEGGEKKKIEKWKRELERMVQPELNHLERIIPKIEKVAFAKLWILDANALKTKVTSYGSGIMRPPFSKSNHSDIVKERLKAKRYLERSENALSLNGLDEAYKGYNQAFSINDFKEDMFQILNNAYPDVLRVYAWILARKHSLNELMAPKGNTLSQRKQEDLLEQKGLLEKAESIIVKQYNRSRLPEVRQLFFPPISSSDGKKTKIVADDLGIGDLFEESTGRDPEELYNSSIRLRLSRGKSHYLTFPVPFKQAAQHLGTYLREGIVYGRTYHWSGEIAEPSYPEELKVRLCHLFTSVDIDGHYNTLAEELGTLTGVDLSEDQVSALTTPIPVTEIEMNNLKNPKNLSAYLRKKLGLQPARINLKTLEKTLYTWISTLTMTKFSGVPSDDMMKIAGAGFDYDGQRQKISTYAQSGPARLELHKKKHLKAIRSARKARLRMGSPKFGASGGFAKPIPMWTHKPLLSAPGVALAGKLVLGGLARVFEGEIDRYETNKDGWSKYLEGYTVFAPKFKRNKFSITVSTYYGEQRRYRVAISINGHPEPIETIEVKERQKLEIPRSVLGERYEKVTVHYHPKLTISDAVTGDVISSFDMTETVFSGRLGGVIKANSFFVVNSREHPEENSRAVGRLTGYMLHTFDHGTYYNNRSPSCRACNTVKDAIARAGGDDSRFKVTLKINARIDQHGKWLIA